MNVVGLRKLSFPSSPSHVNRTVLSQLCLNFAKHLTFVETRRIDLDSEEALKRRKQRAKKRKQQMQKQIEENKVRRKFFDLYATLSVSTIPAKCIFFPQKQTVQKLLNKQARKSKKEEEKVQYQ